jgi:Nif-specific regulatory protein
MPESGAQPAFRREIHELALLYRISELLARSQNLQESLDQVLETLSAEMGMTRGMIVLVDRESGEAYIDLAHGLSDAQKRRGRYRPGEGVTGRVIGTGEPAAVPRVSEEPMFLDRTGARKRVRKQDVSFFCVPIKYGQEVIGALTADRVFQEKDDYHEDVRLLSIVASMIAQAVRARQIVEEERQKLIKENLRLRAELRERFAPENIIGNSARMQEVYELIYQVADSTTTVLIRGESGTGKELVARAIHTQSPRADKPFVKLHCAAIPESLVESELFGHEKGAFTGAVDAKPGKFELAQGGTIFLDEIGELPVPTQIKLLRVLQDREFERVGGTRTLRSTARIIAATNKDLENAVQDAEFREDLYYRINVFPIWLPPLRERKTDILLLADHFLEKYSRILGKSVKRVSTPAIDLLVSYHWPGNVRELENCIERAVLLSSDDVIHSYHLPPTLQSSTSTETFQQESLDSLLGRYEREILVESLKRTRGNKAAAARLLSTTERIFNYRCRRHGIDYRSFRAKAGAGES